MVYEHPGRQHSATTLPAKIKNINLKVLIIYECVTANNNNKKSYYIFFFILFFFLWNCRILNTIQFNYIIRNIKQESTFRQITMKSQVPNKVLRCIFSEYPRYNWYLINPRLIKTIIKGFTIFLSQAKTEILNQECKNFSVGVKLWVLQRHCFLCSSFTVCTWISYISRSHQITCSFWRNWHYNQSFRKRYKRKG